jgi:Ser-tRNA(Ala) deacylase AlaX
MFKLRFLLSQLFIMEVKIPAYLKNSKLYELPTTLVNKEGDMFEFEDSIFHLQGGGQPNDKGWISFDEKKYEILGGASER